jgi:ferritin-like protein
MGSESYHEPLELLSEKTKNLHRAIVSLVEELEAVDWYNQRAEACSDPELKAVLLHHRDEEIEHAMMNLEWIRRNEPVVDENARIYLFANGPITGIEAAETGGAHERGSIEPSSAAKVGAPGGAARGGGGSGGGTSLGVGSLRGS